MASSNVMAAWQLNNENSNLSFVSVKSGAVAETHHFSAMQGKVSEKGFAKVMLDLTSIESNIDIRNERMQNHLFETAKFTSASIETKFDSALINDLAEGKTTTAKLPFTLSLHGQEQTFNADVRITKLADQLIVSSMSPVIIYATNFDMVKGIEKLREIAKLPSIATSVPVTFNFAFNKK